MEVFGSEYPPQPLSYRGTSQPVQQFYYGLNGAYQPTQYHRKAATGIGSTQMIIGIICVTLNSVLLGQSNDPRIVNHVSPIGYGIWGGIFFFIAGLLQVLLGSKAHNKCLIIATMVMCIIAASASAAVITFGIIEAINGDVNSQWKPMLPYGLTETMLGSIMAILAFIEAVISITGAAFCCGDLCCASPILYVPLTSENGQNQMLTTAPVYLTGNQPIMNQELNPAVISPLLGQNSFPGHPFSP